MGTESNLLVDNGYRWIKHIPRGSWYLSGEIKLFNDNCLDTLLELNKKKLDLNPPQKFVRAMAQLTKEQVPWAKVMPPRDHRAFVRKLINEASEAYDNISKDYYVNTWVPQSTVLRNLNPAKIDHTRYLEAVALAGTHAQSVTSFEPDQNGMSQCIDYDRFGTVTGRLTVKSGPSILTLKRDYRDMIVSSEPNGKIIYIDFAALEARILLYEAGISCNKVDLYSYISQELFNGVASRDSIKSAVISELYGVGKHTLGDQLGIEGKELDDFVNKIKFFFKTGDLKKRIKEQFIKTGYVLNRYGRQVVPSAPLDHILLNSYAQSTGVDVSLLGFSSIVDSLKQFPKVKPLYVLHDAIILDVPEENIDDVVSIKKITIPGYVQSFFLKSSFLVIHII